jgi:hypothetical protein
VEEKHGRWTGRHTEGTEQPGAPSFACIDSGGARTIESHASHLYNDFGLTEAITDRLTYNRLAKGPTSTGHVLYPFETSVTKRSLSSVDEKEFGDGVRRIVACDCFVRGRNFHDGNLSPPDLSVSGMPIETDVAISRKPISKSAWFDKNLYTNSLETDVCSCAVHIRVPASLSLQQLFCQGLYMMGAM